MARTARMAVAYAMNSIVGWINDHAAASIPAKTMIRASHTNGPVAPKIFIDRNSSCEYVITVQTMVAPQRIIAAMAAGGVNRLNLPRATAMIPAPIAAKIAV